jgi:hypothetical protein
MFRQRAELSTSISFGSSLPSQPAADRLMGIVPCPPSHVAAPSRSDRDPTDSYPASAHREVPCGQSAFFESVTGRTNRNAIPRRTFSDRLPAGVAERSGELGWRF